MVRKRSGVRMGGAAKSAVHSASVWGTSVFARWAKATCGNTTTNDSKKNQRMDAPPRRTDCPPMPRASTPTRVGGGRTESSIWALLDAPIRKRR